jgi:hypothetical protein
VDQTYQAIGSEYHVLLKVGLACRTIVCKRATRAVKGGEYDV